KRENLKVTVGNLAQIFPERFGATPGEPEVVKPNESTTVSFGISIMDMTEQARETLGLKASGGVKIAEVEANSFAEDVGLKPNDILTAINQHPVASTADVKKIQTTLKPGDAVAFRVLRKDRASSWTPSYVAGTLPTIH